ncbi:enoyl-[acyl-carrier-protein] reductase FabK [Listeria ivanovii]|uniref:Probable nitronate monooxygenase n=1 Tax=Listeria ivanovii (strain ATCC BAA-678 / PAM 55) TaxID=881621 RepID=G2ZDC2_LISIP|nr:enoyl-[acyl-carrier-protein] reductase FabK [Listeria ivanovii]AHI55319.1 2-nitropropane dioxygenase [Listeria ivanovii WSLC3009]AIS64778.1 2-nitropropane dioxygenase [Listeria ivanovii subsp. ivanovii]MBC1758518.1 enoyl-[acyl-carrier-protein] reductase FabK [Listeria ivanovii]MBK3913393.1 enoyl-[acyl-carrier-protein] reductase FabK [Listeria ivanovii subsp. ivanovii]MBK3920489.1 enoyl-[acyl-carrier-protein] reductase FabK [Listeria ivanovii subsp. ivanovii]
MSITNLLNIKYPIIQGAMAQIAKAPLVAAVSNAGGLGIIASGGMSADMLREEIQKTKSLTDKPFGVNLMLMMTNIAELTEVIIEEKIAIVTTGAGTPKTFMPVWKEAGIIVIPVVPSVMIAKRMEKMGADAVIAEGTEAGGHVGETTTMALLPQIVDAVTIPVIGAGGIADGRGIAAALSLGAQGVQIGTRFLATEECPVHPDFKAAVIKASDRDTMVTGRKAGAPVRSIKNKMIKEYIRLEEENADRDTLEELTLGSLRKAVQEGDTDNGSVMAGQIAGLITEIKPCKDVIEEMMAETKQVISNLQLN